MLKKGTIIEMHDKTVDELINVLSMLSKYGYGKRFVIYNDKTDMFIQLSGDQDNYITFNNSKEFL